MQRAARLPRLHSWPRDVLRMRLNEKLGEVEAFGLDRRVFDGYSYNGHRVYLLQNDAYITDEERLHVHFVVFCDRCDAEFALRGTSHPGTEWTPRHVQDVKIAVLGPFVAESCPIENRYRTDWYNW